MARKIKLCECGCEQEVKSGNRFIYGHNRKGKRKSIFFVEKFCECGCGMLLQHANKGQRYINRGYSGRGKEGWRKGKTKEEYPQFARSEECRKNISKAFTEERREKLRKEMTGSGNHNFGGDFSDEYRKNISDSHIGKPGNNRGRTFSPEWRKNISESKKGEKSPNWKGGISGDPQYSREFNNELRKLIRNRDKYQCQLCGCHEEENLRRLCIHHINYDKMNCLPSNLITLCVCCNSKVNYNRPKWQEYFMNKMKDKMRKKVRKLIKDRIVVL